MCIYMIYWKYLSGNFSLLSWILYKILTENRYQRFRKEGYLTRKFFKCIEISLVIIIKLFWKSESLILFKHYKLIVRKKPATGDHESSLKKKKCKLSLARCPCQWIVLWPMHFLISYILFEEDTLEVGIILIIHASTIYLGFFHMPQLAGVSLIFTMNCSGPKKKFFFKRCKLCLY